MSKLLILGSGPLLFEDARRTYAAGARTWQITEPLLADGHEVLLIGQRLPLSYPDDIPREIVVRDEPGFVYKSVHPEVFQSPDYLQEASDEFEPDAVIYPHASASFNSRVLKPKQPIWIDVNGHVMTEAQAKAAVYEDDDFLDHFFLMELDILRHGDVFSSCCDPQTWALLGELGLVGRLNGATNGRLLVESVPVGVSDEEYTPTGKAFRGLDVPEDAFVILWSGGYNTWTDVETMFEGLEIAMTRVPKLHFVSTGGQIDGHDEITYPRMCELIDGSRFRDRFHLRGWIQREKVPNYYLEADVGINCEKPILEVTFGSKQRILDWSRAALPCLSSRLTELSQVMEQEKAGWVFEPGNAKELGNKLATIAGDRDAARKMGLFCRKRFREMFSYAKTIEGFREWAREPWHSPDRKRGDHCIEGMTDEIDNLRVQKEQLKSTIQAIEDYAETRFRFSRIFSNGNQESLPAWIKRVTKTSFQQGGPSLVLRRLLARIAGAGRINTAG